MPVKIYSGYWKPHDAYVTIHYRDTYFWIDDKDMKSKRSFMALMLLLSLTESDEKNAGPLVTVGA